MDLMKLARDNKKTAAALVGSAVAIGLVVTAPGLIAIGFGAYGAHLGIKGLKWVEDIEGPINEDKIDG